jgi:signal transduction histidine kinase
MDSLMRAEGWNVPIDERFRPFLPDLAVAVALALAGLVEAMSTGYDATSRLHLALIALGVAAATGLARPLPGVSLGLVWAIALDQVGNGVALLLTEVAFVYIAFAVARWGSAATVWLSGLSIPVAVIGSVLVLYERGPVPLSLDVGGLPIVDHAYRYSGLPWEWLTAGAALAGLALPWLAGLTVRLAGRVSESTVARQIAEADAARSQREREQAEREREQAREIAQLREGQARLAGDVHDVVGHSLAVILAQAESAQYVPDDDPGALKETMANIAGSARTSLQDIRHVLAGAAQSAPGSAGAFDDLIDGVRAGGHHVETTELGLARPLPPDLELVAHRVLQEMLTNAIKHGRRDQPIRVERQWPDGPMASDLRIEVQNMIEGPKVVAPVSGDTRPMATAPAGAGQGLEGMRRRLEAVGGKLDARRRDTQDGPVFTVTGWVPVSGR